MFGEYGRALGAASVRRVIVVRLRLLVGSLDFPAVVPWVNHRGLYRLVGGGVRLQEMGVETCTGKRIVDSARSA